jgi:UDP-N-acetylglucosamine 2-epimerase
MKVMTVVGTRPEIIKLSLVIKELDKCTEHILVHTGQNYDYELNQIFFDQLKLRKPDHFLNSVGSTVAETIGNVIKLTDDLLEEVKPDAFLVLGDTNSCLCVISAKRRKIPIFHMEAGNRCFDLNVPEEINRRIVDHTSDVNMVYTEHARRYLLNEGLNPHLTLKTGSPMLEVLNTYKVDIDSSTVLTDLSIEKQKYFVLSAHREENVDNPERLKTLVESLDSLSREFDYPIIFSVHPRTRNRLEKIEGFESNKNIRLMKPLGFFEYINLQQNAACVVSDSGTITEESSILSFPAITIRETHERPEGMDEGTLIMSSIESSDLIRNIKVAISHYDGDLPFQLIGDYDTPNVSKKVVRIILSYTQYVNKFVWRKK